MRRPTFWGLCVLSSLVIAFRAGATDPGGVTEGSSPDVPVIEIGDAPTLGPDNAVVTIVEFTDFQCPYCAQGARTLRRLLEVYPTQVRWVIKHYPLRIHADAPLAHEAALAARAQAKFWQMHELLLENQRRLKRDDLIGYARQLNLDVPAFVEALEARRFRSRVFDDIVQGRRLKVGATPTYFVNGKRLVGVRRLGEFRRLIERELSSR